MITTLTIESLAEILQESGFRAIILESEPGSRYIQSASSGTLWWANLKGETDDGVNIFCYAMDFFDPQFDALGMCNAYNGRYSLGTAWVSPDLDDEGQQVVNLDISFRTYGGVTREWISSCITAWDAAIGRFVVMASNYNE